MNYSDSLQLLESFKTLDRRDYTDITIRQKHSRAFFLQRVQRLLDILHNPENKIPHYLHVAGTSGKGSVCSYLTSICSAAGKKTGFFLSPYISDIRERWQINNQPINKKDFIILVQEIKSALEIYLADNSGDAPSIFEIYTVMGLYYFAQKKVDWVVLEVGMGGRIDATNIIKRKTAAIITDIGLDHTKQLGSTITAIAKEKAGIIISHAPVFTSVQSSVALKIIHQTAQKNHAPLFRSQLSPAEKKTISLSVTGTVFNYQSNTYQLQALGVHQARNAALAIDVATHCGIANATIKTGLKKTVQPIRFEIIKNKSLIILDGAHNPQKISSTVHAFKAIFPASKQQKIHLLVGFSADKNTTDMIKQLLSLNPTSIACTKNTANSGRKTMSPGAIARIIKKYSPNPKTKIFLNPHEALNWTKSQASSTDRILITGSIYLSGELRPDLLKNKLD